MSLDTILEGATPGVAEIFLVLRRLILSKLPAAIEEIDSKARMAAFLISPGYKGTVFTLMIARQWVTLGIYMGANLPDPAHLFSGGGKVHGSVKISEISQVNSEALNTLLDKAIETARLRLNK